MSSETTPSSWLSAQALAGAIARGEHSAAASVRGCLERIERINPRLRAVVTLDADNARNRAREADAALARGERWGPLHGVPVTVKDTYETAGLRTTVSYPPLAHYVPDTDATVVARLRSAGAIVLGKTNLPMLGLDWQSASPVHGRCNNPWDVDRTPGGSSGGSAAAVAAGLSYLDVGSDAGGSLRVPAHFCGVYTVMPTENRVSGAGHIPDWGIPGMSGIPRAPRHFGFPGPLARSVADLRLALSLLAGPDGRQHEVPPVPWEHAPAARLDGARIAWTDRLGPVRADADTTTAIAALAERLAGAGASLTRAEPGDLDAEDAWQTWGELFAAEYGATVPGYARAVLRWRFRAMPDRSVAKKAVLRGAKQRFGVYMSAMARRDELISAMEAFLAGYDAWLAPVTPTPAFTHRKPGHPIPIDDRHLPYMLGVGAFTTPLNVTGHPSVVLPAGRSRSGLPIGVQVVGRRWNEPTLLALAEAIDRAASHYGPPPALAGE